jgi:hypothetical protein
VKKKFTAAVSIVLLPLVVGLTQLARGVIIAKGVSEEMQVSFFSDGNADTLCSQVLPRGGMFVTCQGFLLLDRKTKTVKMQSYVTVFPSRFLAEQDLQEMRNWGAVGANVLTPPDQFSLKDLRRLRYRRIS